MNKNYVTASAIIIILKRVNVLDVHLREDVVKDSMQEYLYIIMKSVEQNFEYFLLTLVLNTVFEL